MERGVLSDFEEWLSQGSCRGSNVDRLSWTRCYTDRKVFKDGVLSDFEEWLSQGSTSASVPIEMRQDH